jgi:hypothetical protein
MLAQYEGFNWKLFERQALVTKKNVKQVLDQHAELDFYSDSSLKQQPSDRHIAPLGHIILILSNQSLLLSKC